MSAEFSLELPLLFLLLFEVFPELTLQLFDVLLSQLEELPCCDLFLFVEVASEFEFVLNMSNGVVNMSVDALYFANFLIGNVLEHLDLVVPMLLETLCA